MCTLYCHPAVPTAPATVILLLLLSSRCSRCSYCGPAGCVCVAGLSALLCARVSTGFSCSGRTGFYPHPTSCSHFMACVHGQAFTMGCPPGLYYSPTLKLCDWPSSSGCSLPPVTTDTPPVQCESVGVCVCVWSVSVCVCVCVRWGGGGAGGGGGAVC